MVQTIGMYFDFTSPYSFLALEELFAKKEILENIELRPVMVGKVISMAGGIGPGEIKVKRDYLFKDCLRRASLLGLKLKSPARMPFNPMPLLRMVIACDAKNGETVKLARAIFHYGWIRGEDYEDYEALKNYICKELGYSGEDYDELDNYKEARKILKSNIKEASELGAFGVPTFTVDQEIFWGLDSLNFLSHYLEVGNDKELETEFTRFINIIEGANNEI